MDLGQLFADGVDVPPPPEDFDFKHVPAHGGVWLLTDEHQRPIQLGGCESLRRTLSFRLSHPDQDEKRRTRVDLRAITRRIWWWPTHSQFETAYDYYRIARQLYPDDYLERVAFGPAWFLRVDPSARIPRLTVTQKTLTGKAMHFGPFVGRASCTRYIDLLEELFSLCRCVDILDQAPNGRRCAYADMGKCAAPCDGSIPLERYREMVQQTVDFVRAGPADFIAATEQEMKRAASAREFEKAGAAKRRIDDARKTKDGLYRHVTPADRFDWLVVQRGQGRSQVKPFFVRGGWIDRGEPAKLKQLEDAVGGWIEAMGQASPASLGDDVRQRTEHIWLVSHFLFRSEKLPALFLRADALPDAEALCERVRDIFAAPTRKPDGPPGPGDAPEADTDGSGPTGSADVEAGGEAG